MARGINIDPGMPPLWGSCHPVARQRPPQRDCLVPRDLQHRRLAPAKIEPEATGAVPQDLDGVGRIDVPDIDRDKGIEVRPGARLLQGLESRPLLAIAKASLLLQVRAGSPYVG